MISVRKSREKKKWDFRKKSVIAFNFLNCTKETREEQRKIEAQFSFLLSQSCEGYEKKEERFYFLRGKIENQEKKVTINFFLARKDFLLKL